MRDDSEKVPALLTDYILKGKHTPVLSHFYISVTMFSCKPVFHYVQISKEKSLPVWSEGGNTPTFLTLLRFLYQQVVAQKCHNTKFFRKMVQGIKEGGFFFLSTTGGQLGIFYTRSCFTSPYFNVMNNILRHVHLSVMKCNKMVSQKRFVLRCLSHPGDCCLCLFH